MRIKMYIKHATTVIQKEIDTTSELSDRLCKNLTLVVARGIETPPWIWLSDASTSFWFCLSVLYKEKGVGCQHRSR